MVCKVLFLSSILGRKLWVLRKASLMILPWAQRHSNLDLVPFIWRAWNCQRVGSASPGSEEFLVIFPTILMKCKSYIIQCTHVKSTTGSGVVYSQVETTIPKVNFKTFSHLRKKPVCFDCQPPPSHSPCPRQMLFSICISVSILEVQDKDTCMLWGLSWQTLPLSTVFSSSFML
jgi:hypothetical protein